MSESEDMDIGDLGVSRSSGVEGSGASGFTNSSDSMAAEGCHNPRRMWEQQEVGGRSPGLLDRIGSQFLTLKTFSGKIKKIQKKEFLDMFEKGEYYPPEGCTLFSEEHSPTFYVYGGARSSKPGHWTMANYLFQIKTEKMTGENSAWDIVSFKMLNQSASKTSQFMKLFGASGITDICSESMLRGFVINGKNLDCPSESKVISNDIQIIETAKETTFRSIIIRSGKGSINIDNLKSDEVFQKGDIPDPSYGSCLVRVPSMDSGSEKCAVKIGGAILSNRMSDLEYLFSTKQLWEEKSSSEIHILLYDLNCKKFLWKEVKVMGFEPRAFHSAILVGNFIYIFGGLNIETSQRFGINPVRISLTDWTVSEISVDGLSGAFLGGGITTTGDYIYLVGGFKQQTASERDKPSDTIVQISVDEKGDLNCALSKSFHCGLLGQPSVLLCPGKQCLLICGGSLEKFGIICDGHLPTEKCEHPICKLESNSSVAFASGFSENPNFLGCQGDCKRWFHAFCLGFDYKKYLFVAQRAFWQCNRYDCKKS